MFVSDYRAEYQGNRRMCTSHIYSVSQAVDELLADFIISYRRASDGHYIYIWSTRPVLAYIIFRKYWLCAVHIDLSFI